MSACNDYTRAALAIAFLLLAAIPLFAEENYQRYDVVRKDRELTLEGAFRYSAQTVNARDYFSFMPSASVEYGFLGRHSVGISLPYTVSYYENSYYENSAARNRTFYSFGDIDMFYEFMKKIRHISLFFAPHCAIPLSVSNEYMSREGILQAGSGRWSAGFSVSATGTLDPVVWTASARYTLGFPKQERFYTAWQPGNFQFSLGISNLLNERFGVAAAVYQNIGLPEIQDGVFNRAAAGVSYSTLARIETLVLFEHDYIKLGVDMYMYPLNQPFGISVTYGHSFLN